jgi:SAM-dependent methyltransferase
VLGVAAGIEETIFWATNRARRVLATDRYLEPAGWDDDAPQAMLERPGDYAPCPWNPERLVVEHMDALELNYEDESFDGAFCSSSIEHFGGRAELAQALGELYRVLKPGGIASLSTEYRLRGPGPGLPGTLLFDARELVELVVDAQPWKPVQPIELGLSERTRGSAIPLADEFRAWGRCLGVSEAEAGPSPCVSPVRPLRLRRPHILLEEGDYTFTSVHLALRKPSA